MRVNKRIGGHRTYPVKERRMGGTLVLLLLLAKCSGPPAPAPNPTPPVTRLHPPIRPAIKESPCPDPEAQQRVVRLGHIPRPRKLAQVEPRFPIRNLSTIFTGKWMGELKLDRDGNVVGVEVLRRIQPDPPWPEWEDAIVRAVQQWKYAKTCVGGHPVSIYIVETLAYP